MGLIFTKKKTEAYFKDTPKACLKESKMIN